VVQLKHTNSVSINKLAFDIVNQLDNDGINI
jgi:hypothetical protein